MPVVKRRLNISVVLMVAAILLIAAFQIYWLYMNMEEEKRTLRWRTNFLFRESVFDLRSSKLKLDTTARFRYGLPPDIARFTDAIRQKLFDSTDQIMPRRNSIITLEKQGALSLPDSTPRAGYRSAGRFFEFLIGIDSLQDSLKVKDIVYAYTASLQKEKINVPFSILRSVDSSHAKQEPPPRPEWNKVTIGFTNPVNYQLELGNTTPYLFARLLPQILFSVFLLGLTISAFVFLYRNLQAQHKLTNIKNEFISNITHELKTPISTVSVAIEAIKNFNVLQKPETAREYLDIAGNELTRLSMLVDKVLKLNMFEKQQTELKYDEFDIKQLANEVINSMSLQFEKTKANVYLHAGGDNFIIQADHMHITSVLYNLIDNALKYSKDRPVININILCDAKYCTIKVKDNGIGIDEEYRKKIFEKFFRVPTNNRHNIKGYGLGLSYVAHIVRQHQGTISLESTPGEGSEFTVKLPVVHEKN
ncbi:MAG: HAMP domain-containing histidine kinase [Chitinophagaceae bacterium]|nr:HAMP domain-containing histidine kinase [Chitinophagaceae bacterium]